MEIATFLCLVVLIGLNVHASRRCLRDELVSRSQRIAQLAFIWFIPILGALVSLAVLRNAPEQSDGTYRKDPDMGDDYVTGFGRPNNRGYIRSPDDSFHPVGGGDVSPD